MLTHFENTTLKLKNRGYTIKRVKTFNNFEKIYKNHNLIVAKEAAQTHKDWYKKFGNLYHPKTAELIQRGQNISEFDYKKALASKNSFKMN